MIEERKNTYTLVVSTDGDTITPVRYEMIGYNSLLGSHYDRYYVTYTNYEHRNGSIPLSVFDEVTKGMSGDRMMTMNIYPFNSPINLKCHLAFDQGNSITF